MTDEPLHDLVGRVRRLLELGLADEPAAIARFYRLVDRYGCEEIGEEVATVARDAHQADRPSLWAVFACAEKRDVIPSRFVSAVALGVDSGCCASSRGRSRRPLSQGRPMESHTRRHPWVGAGPSDWCELGRVHPGGRAGP